MGRMRGGVGWGGRKKKDGKIEKHSTKIASELGQNDDDGTGAGRKGRRWWQVRG